MSNPQNWAALLKGEEIDLDDWAFYLPPPFDPWVEAISANETTYYVLRSASFAGATSGDDVEGQGVELVASLSGAMSVAIGSGQVTFDCACIVRDGSVQRVARAVSVTIVSTARVRADMSGGSEVLPSLPQQWCELARSSDLVADMLRHFAKAPSWYELYKAYECVDALAKKLGSKPQWPTRSELARFTHTANVYRHGLAHSSRQAPPPAPMHLVEATRMIREMAEAVLSEMARGRW